MKTLQQQTHSRPLPALAIVLVLAASLLLSCTAPTIETPLFDTEENANVDQAQVDQAQTPEQAAPDEETESDAGANTLPDAVEANANAAEDSAGAAQVASVSDELYKGMAVGFTEEGFPFRGDPDAPIVMYEFSDYQCPFCNRHTLQVEPVLNDSYTLEGKLRTVFRDFPLTSIHPNAEAAASAALCAADTSANAFWQMHDSLFDTQAEWSALAEPTAYFAELGSGIGLDADALTACIESGEKVSQIEDSVAEAQALGYNSTPSFHLVNSAAAIDTNIIGAQPFENFASFIDALAAGEVPCGLPAWACPAGLAPDPDRPGITMAGDFYHGDPSAKTTVIEFSDFQCGFCRRHVEETQPLLDEEFVDTGEIYWVFKNFPALGPASQASAIAGECAAYQGEFEPMKQMLFDRVSEWSSGDSTAVFTEMAAELDLDADEFASCLVDPATAQSVADDFAEGQRVVQRGTPTFVVLQGERGQLIEGALPYERFSELLKLAVEQGVPN